MSVEDDVAALQATVAALQADLVGLQDDAQRNDDAEISDLPRVNAVDVPPNALVPFVDVDDLSQAATGTNKAAIGYPTDMFRRIIADDVDVALDEFEGTTIVLVVGLTESRTVQLPAAATASQNVVVKDVYGLANADAQIHIAPAEGDTVAPFAVDAPITMAYSIDPFGTDTQLGLITSICNDSDVHWSLLNVSDFLIQLLIAGLTDIGTRVNALPPRTKYAALVLLGAQFPILFPLDTSQPALDDRCYSAAPPIFGVVTLGGGTGSGIEASGLLNVRIPLFTTGDVLLYAAVSSVVSLDGTQQLVLVPTQGQALVSGTQYDGADLGIAVTSQVGTDLHFDPETNLVYSTGPALTPFLLTTALSLSFSPDLA